jgi:alpha-beta hydrolase superfamily lysophospholipase
VTQVREWKFQGTRELIAARKWVNPNPRYLAVFVHGYAEHAGRYHHLAESLVNHGAAVYAPDHMGAGCPQVPAPTSETTRTSSRTCTASYEPREMTIRASPSCSSETRSAA